MAEGSSIGRHWVLCIVSAFLMTMGVQCKEDKSDTASGTGVSSQASDTQVAETNQSHAGAVGRAGESSSWVDTEKSSPEIYKDRNDYFVAVIPPGWRIQDYPAETIRTKLKFNHPTPGHQRGHCLVDLLLFTDSRKR